MKYILQLGVLALLCCALPAHAQYVYLDVNGDGLNFEREVMVGNPVPPNDVLNAGVTTIDVWFVTNQHADGSAVVCADTQYDFPLRSYQAVLRYSGSGTVTFTGWTDVLGFDVGIITAGDGTIATSGTDVWFGRIGGPTDWRQPGAYKVGTLSVTVTGTPSVFFATSSAISGNAQTAFDSSCPGARFDGVIRLGPQGDPEYDFYESFGAFYTNPVVHTTWGKIKDRYR